MKNNNFPKITVIMSAYNDENNVKKSIDSILNQTYQNIELLVMDDGSSDKTYEVVNSISDKRIKLYKNTINLGLTKSLNILINQAQGELIARQDSDDISHHARLEKQYNFLKLKNLDACTTRAKVKDSNKSIPRLTHFLPTKLVIRYKNPFIHGTLLIRKKVLYEIGLYDENYKYSQDYKLYLELLDKKYTIKLLNKQLYILNMADNISTMYKEEQRQDFKNIKKSYFS